MPEYLKKSKPSGSIVGESSEDPKNFYAHRKYRKWRDSVKKAQRIIDEKIAHELYEKNQNIPLEDYQSFLKSDNPLCKEHLEQGIMHPGRVLDHIKPIEKGGAVYDEENLQWLCDESHNKKRAKEDKKPYSRP